MLPRRAAAVASGASPVPPHAWKCDAECHVCKKRFNLIKRRHHCRRCGHSVCGNHSQHQAMMQDLHGDSYKSRQRICNYCHDELTTHFRESGAMSYAQHVLHAAIQAQQAYGRKMSGPKRSEYLLESLASTFASAPTMVAYSNVYPNSCCEPQPEEDKRQVSAGSYESTESVTLDDIYTSMLFSDAKVPASLVSDVRSSRGSVLSFRNTLDFYGCAGHNPKPATQDNQLPVDEIQEPQRTSDPLWTRNTTNEVKTLDHTTLANMISTVKSPRKAERLRLALNIPSAQAENTTPKSLELNDQENEDIVKAQKEYKLFLEAYAEKQAQQKQKKLKAQLAQHWKSAQSYIGEKEFFAASLELKHGLALDASSTCFTLALGKCLLELSQYEEALEVLQAIEQTAPSARLMTLLGHIYIHMHDSDRAIIYLTQAIQLSTSVVE